MGAKAIRPVSQSQMGSMSERKIMAKEPTILCLYIVQNNLTFPRGVGGGLESKEFILTLHLRYLSEQERKHKLLLEALCPMELGTDGTVGLSGSQEHHFT